MGGAADDMLLFAAVVRAGSFTGAARVLGITKQSVSERVATLEARVGVRLLHRTTRQLSVTDVGARYAERCLALAAQVDDAHRELQDQQREPSGVLRVSAPVLFGRRCLMPAVTAYLARFPRVRVELALADRRVDLIAERFDVAVRVGFLDDSSLLSKKLDEGHIHVVASPAFVREHGAVTPRRLATTRVVGIRAVETWDVDGSAVRVEPTFVVNDLELACDAAVSGVGVAQLPALVCRDAVKSGRLVVLPGFPAALRPVWAVTPSRDHLDVKVRAFLDALGALLPMPALAS